MARVLTLPPFPINAQPGSYMWLDWWRQLQDYIQEITKVADSGDIDFTSTIAGYATIPTYYVLVANYIMFTSTIQVDSSTGIIFNGSTTSIGINGVAGPIKPSTCSVTQFDGTTVTSRGVGVIDNNADTIIPPAFTIAPGTGTPLIVITGQYYVSE